MKLFREAFYPLIAVIAAFAIGGVIIAIIGDNPFAAFWIFINSSFGSINGITETLFYATPLIFTGLAVAVASASLKRAFRTEIQHRQPTVKQVIQAKIVCIRFMDCRREHIESFPRPRRPRDYRRRGMRNNDAIRAVRTKLTSN